MTDARRAENDHNRAMDDHSDARDDRVSAIDDHDSLIVIKTQVGEIKTTLEKIDKKLMGNGTEGLCATVLRHDTALIGMKESHEKTSKNTIVAVTVIVSIGMLVMAVLNYLKI